MKTLADFGYELVKKVEVENNVRKHDEMGFLIYENNNGTIQEWKRDEFGRAIWHSIENIENGISRIVSTMKYDKNGNMKEKLGSDGYLFIKKTTIYDKINKNGAVKRISTTTRTNFNSPKITSYEEKDALGRIVKRKFMNGIMVDISYNGDYISRKVKTLPSGEKVVYTYNDVGLATHMKSSEEEWWKTYGLDGNLLLWKYSNGDFIERVKEGYFEKVGDKFRLIKDGINVEIKRV